MARLRGREKAAVLGVEGQPGCPLGHEIGQRGLRQLVDREGNIAARAVAKLSAPGVRSELGQHALAQMLRQFQDKLRTAGRRVRVHPTMIAQPERIVR